jgi:hypothetical protein
MTNIEAEKEIQELRQEVERLKAELAKVKSLMSVMGRGGSSSVSGNGGTGKTVPLTGGRLVSAITISKDGNAGAPQIMFGGNGSGSTNL